MGEHTKQEFLSDYQGLYQRQLVRSRQAEADGAQEERGELFDVQFNYRGR